jgi:hypothetical protein
VPVSTHARLQFVRPPAQAAAQPELSHTCSGVHALLQAPQWSGFDFVSTQSAPHFSNPAAQPPPSVKWSSDEPSTVQAAASKKIPPVAARIARESANIKPSEDSTPAAPERNLRVIPLRRFRRERRPTRRP